MGQIIDGSFFSDYDGQDIDERLTLAGGVSNPNLLDNPWFTVNQKGTTTTSTNEAFISDCWHIYRGTGVVNADKTITFTATQAGAAIYQISPYRSDIVGKVVTLSIMNNNDSVESGTITVPASESSTVTLPSGLSLNLNTRNNRDQFTIFVPNGTTITLRAVKLEVGSISTLANDVAPNYELELLKCQGYMGGFLNAASHNAIYRGKNLGTSVTAEQYAAISAGTFDDMFIGDYWVIDNVTWRIAAFDYYLTTGDTACATHHVTIVPDSNLYTARMNATNTTASGYVGSEMYTTNLEQAKTIINAAFGESHILTHRQYLNNAVTNGRPSGGAWYNSQIELMTEQNVYGCKIFGSMSDGTTIVNNNTVDKSQYPLFAYNPPMISNRQYFWLRDVVSAAFFATVTNKGDANYSGATDADGVRPAFSIKA